MTILLLHSRNVSRRRHLARARDYAREHGEPLLLMMKDPTWEHQYVDLAVNVDTSSIEQTVTAAMDLATREFPPITSVATFVEPAVPSAAAVAEALGLRFVTEQAAYLARDKFAMRTAFDAAGVEQPPFGVGTSVTQAREVAARIGYPLVAKPFIGAGSKYVQRIDDEAQLDVHFEQLRSAAWDNFAHDPLHARLRAKYQGALLLEGYVPGGEISVESLVVQGIPQVIAIHDKPLPMIGPFFEEVYFSTPTMLSDRVVQAVIAATVAANSALGISTGATHTEFRITKDGTPVILEVAARAGGACVYQSVLLSTGVDLVAGVLDLARGVAPMIPDANALARPVGHYLLFADRPGELTGVDGWGEARAHAAVVDLELYHELGDQLNTPPHVSQAHGHVIFTADHPADLEVVRDHLARTIRLRTR